jgi:hypothetical protein
MQQAGAIPIDYATALVEIMADNADPAAGEVYAALDLPFAVLLGQLVASYTKQSHGWAVNLEGRRTDMRGLP